MGMSRCGSLNPTTRAIVIDTLLSEGYLVQRWNLPRDCVDKASHPLGYGHVPTHTKTIDTKGKRRTCTQLNAARRLLARAQKLGTSAPLQYQSL